MKQILLKFRIIKRNPGLRAQQRCFFEADNKLKPDSCQDVMKILYLYIGLPNFSGACPRPQAGFNDARRYI